MAHELQGRMSSQGQKNTDQSHDHFAVSFSDPELKNNSSNDGDRLGRRASVDFEVLQAPAELELEKTNHSTPSSPTDSKDFNDWIRDPAFRYRQQSSISVVYLNKVRRRLTHLAHFFQNS